MKISIAMATYNGDQYLKAQLQSFVEQSRQPDELIITDDCSIDETETVVREFAKTAPFKVKFYRNEKKLGYCGNFNAALMKTTGDLVFLSDQDDVWFPEKIEHMMGVAESHPEALVVMNDAALTDGDLNEVGLTKVGQIWSAGYTLEHFMMGCCCGIRRELLDLCMPIPSGFSSHDGWLVWFADGLDAKVIESRVLQYYRRHESNESQFIANRTVRVSRAAAFLHSVKKLFEKDGHQRAQIQVEQTTLFALGIRDAIKVAPEKYLVKLDQLLSKTESRISTLKQRIEIREKWFIPRFFAAMRLFAKGGYRNTNGFKAVIRDLVG
ncbi:MAG: glycosyltransferase [Marinobacter sp.]|nr:glycosyltransferase [Marinobacter sp.]